MNNFVLLWRRNLKLFYRDRAGVFFSLLSPLILVGLYVLFLGRLQQQSLASAIPTADPAQVNAFVDAWVFSGIAMITTLTASLAVMGNYVDDLDSGRFLDFLVAPVRRSQLVIGYLSSGFTISLVMSSAILGVGQGYLVIRYGAGLSLAHLGLAVLFIALSSATMSALCAFIVSFVKTNSAYGALSAVVGTLAGFLAGAYIPPGALPTGAVSIMNMMPFAQSAVLIRQPFTHAAAADLTAGDAGAAAGLADTYGLTAHVGNFELTPSILVGSLVVFLVIFTALGTWRIGRRIH